MAGILSAYTPTGASLLLTGATAATRYVGATASGAPSTGTFAVGDYVIDQTGNTWVCVTAGSPGTWVNTAAGQGGEVWIPGDNGLLGSVGSLLDGATQSAVLVGGTRYLRKYVVRYNHTITNIWFQVSSVGSGTSTGCFVGLYSSAGTLLSGSADCLTNFNTAGPNSVALTTPQAVTAGTFVWISVLSNESVTNPTLRASAPNSNMSNTNIGSVSNLAAAVNGTGVTTMVSITPASNTAAGSFPIWFGVN